MVVHPFKEELFLKWDSFVRIYVGASNQGDVDWEGGKSVETLLHES